jgi:hypothetical protein
LGGSGSERGTNKGATAVKPTSFDFPSVNSSPDVVVLRVIGGAGGLGETAQTLKAVEQLR